MMLCPSHTHLLYCSEVEDLKMKEKQYLKKIQELTEKLAAADLEIRKHQNKGWC